MFLLFRNYICTEQKKKSLNFMAHLPVPLGVILGNGFGPSILVSVVELGDTSSRDVVDHKLAEPLNHASVPIRRHVVNRLMFY